MSAHRSSRRSHLRQLAALGAGAFAPAWSAASPQRAVPGSPDDVPRMSITEFKTRLDKGEVVVVDVRSVADYRLGHIPGARSVPLYEVASRADDLRGLAKPIVTYCT
jgi:3-mercaptopyruvate sulfurtransferase SseA